MCYEAGAESAYYRRGSLHHGLGSLPLGTSAVLIVERDFMEGGGVHFLVFDAQRIELQFDDPLAILSSESLCQPPFEFGGHRLLLLALPLLSLEVHLLLVLALHLKESGTFALVEVRLLSLGDAAILQSLELPLGLARQFRLSLEARLIVLDLDLQQLLLRENVARPAVFCSSITSKE